LVQTGEEIYNHIRGLNPWPVAFTTLDGQSLKIWRSEKVTGTKSEAPGTVIKNDPDGITVSTGNDTAIKIKELQPSGKTKMTCEEFYRGAGSKILVGSRLGE
jgi:methionyl-tRNA formyltransferase